MVTEAPAARAALTEATKLWPDRSRASDGILPSNAHSIQNPSSDHERGNAFDLTHDPTNGVDCHTLATHVIADHRTKYIIWNRRIWNPVISPRWRPYLGSNPHTSHMHVSIKAELRNDTSSWWTFTQAKKEALMADDPNLPNMTGPVHYHFYVDPNTGHCIGYHVYSERTGELHGHGPAAPFFGRSEVVIPSE